ncbi:MAG: EamA family transporter RarD [Sphingobium sp.]|nr:EamA family transporter RarD [Sphingobium sp.]
MSGALPRADRTGLAHGLGAYLLWGLLPLYFKLFPGVSPIEIVAHRVVWSVAFLAVILAATRLYPAFTDALRSPRMLGALTLSALLIAINWLVFIWAVSAGHVLAGSLGYFLNPLVSILIGTLFLHERLRRVQIVAVLIAAAGVAVLAAGEWQTLWVSLSLAISFAFYGLVRKLTPVPASVGLAVETLVLLLPALAALAWFAHDGTLAFGRASVETTELIGLGVVTSVPLILFASAARRLPMVTLGLLQYVAPTMQFFVGAVLFGEPLSLPRLVSFGLIWAALALFVWDSLRGLKRT